MMNSTLNDDNLCNTLDHAKVWDVTTVKNSGAKPASSLRSVDVTAKPVQVQTTDFSYTIDRENHALHLKVKTAGGDVIREVVFNKIDLHVMNMNQLKGIWVDDKS